MINSIYSGLWVAFGENTYKFGPYYKKMFDIIQDVCGKEIEILQSIDYDADLNFSRTNIVTPKLSRDECEVFDLISLNCK